MTVLTTILLVLVALALVGVALSIRVTGIQPAGGQTASVGR